jgi:2-oxoglutarate ferredoxin oxidoreductase subunit delta
MPRISINQSRCKGCGLCVDVCPKNLISVAGEMNKKGVYPSFSPQPELCTGCRLCVTVCPDVAITILEE